MKVFTYLVVALIAALLVILPISRKIGSLSHDYAVKELQHTALVVQKRLQGSADQLNSQLAALGSVISKDIDFSMKLIVEKDPMAPQVYEMASRYMDAMGLSVLDVVNDSRTVVSSGQFPAKAGNPIGEKAGLLDSKPLFLVDNIKGRDALTFQAKTAFTCSGVAMEAIGGWVVDSVFLAQLAPRDGVRLILKNGSEVQGMSGIKTMSEVKNNTIIINDRTWLAAEIPLPSQSDGTLSLILLMPEPAKLAVTSLF
jgi:hypothetical protein